MVDDLLWHGLKVGDWATWFAGLATFLAVCVALGIPWLQSRQARKERRMHEDRSAQILAIELSELFLRFRRGMIESRSLIHLAVNGDLDGSVVSFVNRTTLWGTDELPHGADLRGFSHPVAPSIAAFRATLSMYNGSLQRALALVETEPLHECVVTLKLQAMLDAAQGALARAAGHLQRFEPSYGLIDYFDRGDGTKVQKLKDYCDSQ